MKINEQFRKTYLLELNNEIQSFIKESQHSSTTDEAKAKAIQAEDRIKFRVVKLEDPSIPYFFIFDKTRFNQLLTSEFNTEKMREKYFKDKRISKTLQNTVLNVYNEFAPIFAITDDTQQLTRVIESLAIMVLHRSLSKAKSKNSSCTIL